MNRPTRDIFRLVTLNLVFLLLLYKFDIDTQFLPEILNIKGIYKFKSPSIASTAFHFVGYYIYTEASGDRVRNDAARLSSFAIQPTFSGCSVSIHYTIKAPCLVQFQRTPPHMFKTSHHNKDGT